MNQKIIAVLMMSLLAVACSGQKTAAEAAFAQVQSAVAPVGAELQKYAPDEYAQFSAMLDDMKAKLNSQDYGAVVAKQSAIMSELTRVSGVAAANRQKLTKQVAEQWGRLKGEVPALIARLSDKLDQIKTQGRLPAGVSRQQVQEVTAALADVNAEWSAALATSSASNLAAANEQALKIQRRCEELAARLGIGDA